MNKVLITGGSGFIGSHLVDKMSINHKVIAIDNFFQNNKLKKFAKSNGHFIIKLDELATMELNDFYDSVHTTPQGSKKIAKIIYPFLKEILN